MKHTKLSETKKKERTMINLDPQNEIHLVEWDETHLVDEQGDLRAELNQVEDLKIYFPNFEERVIEDDLNSILGIYSVVEQGHNNKDNSQDKKSQKKKSQTSMSQKLLRFHFLIFSMIRVFQ